MKTTLTAGSIVKINDVIVTLLGDVTVDGAIPVVFMANNVLAEVDAAVEKGKEIVANK